MSTDKVDKIEGSSGNQFQIPKGIAYSANVSGNVSVARSLAVGYTDGRVPQANLEVAGNANVGILTATSLRVNGTAIATTFLGLTDTPSIYSSHAGK